MDKIMVIGCSGQIGSELTLELRKLYGNANVIATDIRPAPADVLESGPFEIMDVLDNSKLHLILEHEKITQIYHLAAILSGRSSRIFPGTRFSFTRRGNPPHRLTARSGRCSPD